MMGDSEFVDGNLCKLHREVLDIKIAACDRRIDGILAEIQGVRDLQRQILYTLIIIGFVATFTLIGVLLGRGVDFGWIGLLR